MNVESKVRVVGIGAAGIRMAEAVEALKLPNVLTVAVDVDAECAKNAAVAKKLPMFMDENAGRGTGGNTKIAKDAAVKYIKYLAQIARKTPVLVLLGGLGGGTASIIAPVILKLVQKQTIAISIFAMPLDIEGNSRALIAQRSFEFIKSKSTAAVALENDKMLSDNLVGAQEALAKANEKVADVVDIIASGFSRGAFLQIDTGAFESMFEGKRSYAGCSKGAEAQIDKIFDNIKSSPMFDKDMSSQNILAAIKCPKDMSMDSIKNVLKTARDKFRVSDRIMFCVCPSESSKELKVLILSTKTDPAQSAKRPDLPLSEEEPAGYDARQSAPSAPAEKAQNAAPKAAADISDDNNNSISQSQAIQEEGRQISSLENAGGTDGTDDNARAAPVPRPPADKPVEMPTASEGDVYDDMPAQTGEALVPEDAPMQSKVDAPVEVAPKPQEKKRHTQKEQMVLNLDERGLFENTPPNERKGVDLDVPTFKREKIKITLL